MTRPPTSMRAAMLILGGASLILGGIIVMEFRLGPTRQGTAQGPVPVTIPGPAARAEQDAERGAWVKTALAKPLFSPTRRPSAQAVAPVVVERKGVPRLTAVMTGPFGRRAVFAGPEGGKPLVVETGDSVGEFRVQAIDSDGVTLSGPDGVRHLRPSFAEEAPPIPQNAIPPNVRPLPPGRMPR